MKTYVWMMVTDDELRLPLAVANTARELSKITGKSINAINSAISHSKNGKRRSSYERVEIDDEEDEEIEIDRR